MSGTPTEAEVQAQWRNAVDVLETMRAHIDTYHAGVGDTWDALQQSVEGTYTPAGMTSALANFRAGCSALVDSNMAQEFITPALYEYGRILSAHATLGYGAGFTNLQELFKAIYEWFVDTGENVESRAITYDTSATAGGSNIGNGAMSRITEDENGFDLEFCHIEKKTFKCVSDQNTGGDENAEAFEVVGQTASPDAVMVWDKATSQSYSGEASSTVIHSHHAGTGVGGSLLNNSSFSEYSSTGTPKFTSWTETSGGANLTQDTTNYYRTHPGSQTDASLKISGNAKITQPLTSMRTRRLNREQPYFLRLMYNRQTGSGDGTLNLRLGSTEVNVTLSAQTGWNELIIPMDKDCWFKNFNEDPMDIEIELSSYSTGYVLIDDVLFAPYDYVDGTYWFLRGNAASHTPWLLDDTLTFTDTGGAPTTGKIQWWLFMAGIGYLPSTTGTPSFTEPT